jgi:hypothetical protein
MPDDRNDPLQRQTFWTRRGGPDLSAEVDYDRPCPVCGYFLKGLPVRSRCPECGALGGWNLYEDPVAWDDRRSIGAFFSTCATAIFNSHRLARHVWCPQRMDLNAARTFRRIALAIGTISLLLVAFVVTMRATSIAVALASAPFDAAAIVVWLNAVTIDPISRLKEWSLNTARGRRVHAIVYYASAWLVLSPLQFVLLALVNDPENIPGPAVAAIHVALLMAQLWLGTVALGWLNYELVEMPAIEAHTLAHGPFLTAMATAAITLIAVPATVAMVMTHLIGP